MLGTQTRFVNAIREGFERDIHWFVVLKARQIGISTVSQALDLFWPVQVEGLSGAVVVHEDPAREAFRAQFDLFIDKLPKRWRPPVIAHNRYQMVFAQGSRLQYAVAGTKKKGGALGKSKALVYLHATEVSAWGDREGVASLKATLAESNPNRLYIWESPLALDTPVATPSGWSTIGGIKKGDMVFSADGAPCKVVGESPIFIGRKCFEIKFSNGETIRADSEHKWQVEVARWKNNPQWKTAMVKTEELDTKKHRVLVNEAIQAPDIELPIDPYLLGVWLGDGRTDSPSICAGDADIEELRGLLKRRGCQLGPIGKYGWRVGKFTVLGVRSIFSKLGLLGRKHIPKMYLRSSERQRRQLLAGLMDTDGHISSDNFRAEYCSVLPELVDGVAELLSSLGIKFTRGVLSVEGKVREFPSGRSYACRRSERLRFCEDPKKTVFNLGRKADIHAADRVYTWRKSRFLKVVSVTQVASVPTKCIAVDHPSHLFLVGKTMIPTHNTAQGFNHFEEMWQEAKRARTQSAVFIGWHHNELYRVSRDSDAYRVYWGATGRPTRYERAAMRDVRALYGSEIDDCQWAWYRWQVKEKQGDELLMKQNYPTTEMEAFIESGSAFFSGAVLTELMKRLRERRREGVLPETYRIEVKGEFKDTEVVVVNERYATLTVWEKTVGDGAYVIAADPAYGSSDWGDRFVISIWRCFGDRMVQAAEFVDHQIDTYAFAWILAYLAGYYSSPRYPAAVILEINGPGQAVMNEINNLKRMRFISSSDPARAELGNVMRGINQFIYRRVDSLSGSGLLQFQSTYQTKNRAMYTFRDYVARGMMDIRSEGLVHEMRGIKQEEGSAPEGSGRDKDDRVMGAALAAVCWDAQVRSRLIQQGVKWRPPEAGAASTIPPTGAQKALTNYLKAVGIRAGELQRPAKGGE